MEINLCINCKPAFGDRKIRRIFQSSINVVLIPIWGLNSFIQLSTFNAAVLSEKFKNIVTFRLHPVFTKETREVFLHCVRDKKKRKKILLVRKGSDSSQTKSRDLEGTCPVSHRHVVITWPGPSISATCERKRHR